MQGRQGIEVLNDNYYFAANTLIVGLPGETDDDGRETIELVKNFDGMETVVAPMLCTDYHNCWYVSAKPVSRWSSYVASMYFMNPIVKIIATVFMKFGIRYCLRLIRDEAKHAGIELA